eukprot:972706-Pyramimonas_sp.AAC.1
MTLQARKTASYKIGATLCDDNNLTFPTGVNHESRRPLATDMQHVGIMATLIHPDSQAEIARESWAVRKLT